MLRYLPLLFAAFFTACSQPVSPDDTRPLPADLVNPLIDAANSRWFFFSSACRPFGMVNLSPDNLVEGAWGSGYRYDVDTIRGFSHVHAWQLAGVSVMPVNGDVDYTRGAEGFASPFSHEDETVKPGYQKVHLRRYDITAEITSTTRVGFHRYTFPENKPGEIVFNLGGTLGPSQMVQSSLRKVSDTEIEGYTTNAPTRRRPKPFRVYFVAQFDRAFQAINGWEGETLINDISQVEGDVCGGIMHFDNPGSSPVMMKVGISYVSEAQARLNLETELNHWEFDQIVAESHDTWNEWLGKIEVEGGTHDQQVRFYTDLWHALQGRRTVSDVNGLYTDMTGDSARTRQIPLDAEGKPAFNHYNSDSYWGAQWTINTLWGMAYPQVVEEFCQSMLLMYRDGGLIPRGPSGGNYTYVMTGASATPFFVSAYMKGIGRYKTEELWTALKKNHMPGGIMAKAGYEHETSLGGGLSHYIQNGYVPYPIPEGKFGFHQDGASLTLEYGYQDWTLAQMAKKLGKQDEYQYFMERSKGYKHLYDPATGWIRPRDVAGKWLEPFDPYNYEHGFNESNGAQSTWFVPHDLPGLAELMGGKAATADKLNQAFETAARQGFTSGKSHDGELEEQLRRIPINYGNQPSMQTAYIFNYLERPDLTQYWVREVIDSVYSGVDPHTGYSGDEDQGLMGSLAVLMKIGLFSMQGGANEEPVYELSGPIFEKVTIHLDQRYYPGEKFVIRAKGASSENRYIHSARLNGKPLETWWFYHRDFAKGGELELEMGAKVGK
ncbi:MAG: GH92 family glycosyl hydrolase [Bacteroidia bacterium]